MHLSIKIAESATITCIFEAIRNVLILEYRGILHCSSFFDEESVVLVNLNLHNKKVLIAGGGNVGERMALKFLTEGCHVVVGSIDFTEKLKQSTENGKLKLVQLDADRDNTLLERLVASADIVIAATNECTINKEIIDKARRKSALVCVVDNPSASDFSPVAITTVGGIQIAVYTAGKSPAMAKMLRERIAKTITPHDVLQVELLLFARGLAKAQIQDSKAREGLMYQILRDKKINALLEKGLTEEAKSLVKKVIEEC